MILGDEFAMKLLMLKKQVPISFFLIFLLAMLISIAGCDPDTDVIGDIVEEELNDFDPDDVEEADPEEPDLLEPEEPSDEVTGTPPTYYWPWLSHAILDLSSGEVIAGPDIIMSDPGFMAEFTEDYRYEGRLFWVVEDSNVFTLEWVHLSFSVDFFDDSDFARDLNFEIRVDDIEPLEDAEEAEDTEDTEDAEPAEDIARLEEHEVEQLKTVDGFVVEINRVILGRGQESNISAEPVDFVALDIIMYVESDSQ